MKELTVYPITPSDWQLYKKLRLAALAESPDAFGGTLANSLAYTDEEWQARLLPANPPVRSLPLFARVNGTPCGLAWGRIENATPTVAHLYQVWIDPTQRGLGLGKMLLTAFLDWAKAEQVSRAELGVTIADSAAWKMYTRLGFRPCGDPEPLRPDSNLLVQRMILHFS